MDAAVLLAKQRSVLVRAHSDDVARLTRAGFVEAPQVVESLVRAPIALDIYPRRYRKTLRRSVEEWQRLGLRLQLHDMARYGVERFLDQLYFPLFARTMYERGIAPHHANTIDGLMELIDAGIRVAVVSTASDDPVGAALLRPSPSDPRRVALHGPSPEGHWEEGLVYSLGPGLDNCRRALMIKLAEAVAADGARWFSLGRDLALCESGYAAVFEEKLRLASSVVACFGTLHEMYSLRPRDADSFALLEWDPTRAALEPRLFGADSKALMQVAERLGRVSSPTQQ
ncbi:MAG: hypothetical protein AAGC55_08510 [Myxococcota bacterium]